MELKFIEHIEGFPIPDEKYFDYFVNYFSKDHILIMLSRINLELTLFSGRWKQASWQKKIAGHYIKEPNNLRLISKSLRIKNQNTLFNRVSVLYAIDKILPIKEQNNTRLIQEKDIVLFFLSLNKKINRIKSTYESNRFVKMELQKLLHPEPFVNIFHVGLIKSKAIFSNQKLKILFKEYGQINRINFSTIRSFSLSVLMGLIQKNPNQSVFLFENDIANQIVNFFQKKNSAPKQHEFDFSILKSKPLYKTKNGTIALDINFLGEFTNKSIINDFFFNFLRSKSVKRTNLMALIGGVFESEVCSYWESVFKNKSTSVYKSLEGLKIRLSAGEIEIADFYYRQNNFVAIGQIKSSEKNIKDTFRSTEEQAKEILVEKSGLKQLIDTIHHFSSDTIKKIDADLPTEKQLTILPILIVEDDAIVYSEGYKFLQNKLFKEVENIKKSSPIIKRYNFKKLLILNQSSALKFTLLIRKREHGILSILREFSREKEQNFHFFIENHFSIFNEANYFIFLEELPKLMSEVKQLENA